MITSWEICWPTASVLALAQTLRTQKGLKLSAVIDGFEATRVVGSRESCEEIVPKFSGSLIAAPTAAAGNGRDEEGAVPLAGTHDGGL